MYPLATNPPWQYRYGAAISPRRAAEWPESPSPATAERPGAIRLPSRAGDDRSDLRFLTRWSNVAGARARIVLGRTCPVQR